MQPPQALAFETVDQLEQWLEVHHDVERELWIRIFKKSSGQRSVTWNDCVVVAIAWNWIDGQRKAYDEVSFLHRFTPRRPRSSWSKRNCEHAERLIAEGRMHPPGLAQVEAARQDGRWEQAYSGSADMVIPDDFLKALRKNAAAKRCFAALKRGNLYVIYYRIQSAKRVETRKKRIADIVEQLARGEVPDQQSRARRAAIPKAHGDRASEVK